VGFCRASATKPSASIKRTTPGQQGQGWNELNPGPVELRPAPSRLGLAQLDRGCPKGPGSCSLLQQRNRRQLIGRDRLPPRENGNPSKPWFAGAADRIGRCCVASSSTGLARSGSGTVCVARGPQQLVHWPWLLPVEFLLRGLACGFFSQSSKGRSDGGTVGSARAASSSWRRMKIVAAEPIGRPRPFHQPIDPRAARSGQTDHGQPSFQGNLRCRFSPWIQPSLPRSLDLTRSLLIDGHVFRPLFRAPCRLPAGPAWTEQLQP